MAYELKDFRREMRALGYKIKTKTYSEFVSASVFCCDGESVLGGYFTKEELEMHKQKHAAALAIVDKYKGQTFDGCFRVVIG